jgi:alkylhydroperoxidase AhpD family core domain
MRAMGWPRWHITIGPFLFFNLILMATIKPPTNPESDPRVKAVFDDIRATRKTDFVNNLWRALAFNPALLESTWAEVKQVMATPSHLDPLTKELIYVAVSIANSCSYCVHSHTAAARAKGMTDEQHAELLAIVSLAAKTNHLANGLQLPLDAAFDAGAAA